MSKSKAKGTAFETLIVRYLRENGFPYAERRALTGNADKGDITGTGPLVWECKNHAALKLAEWMRETETERKNANADHGILVVKRRGSNKPAEQYVVLTLETVVKLLKESY